MLGSSGLVSQDAHEKIMATSCHIYCQSIFIIISSRTALTTSIIAIIVLLISIVIKPCPEHCKINSKTVSKPCQRHFGATFSLFQNHVGIVLRLLDISIIVYMSYDY